MTDTKIIGQHLAAICTPLGDKDQAFAWLEKDFEEHSAELQHIMERVQFEQIRHEPRGIDLIPADRDSTRDFSVSQRIRH